MGSFELKSCCDIFGQLCNNFHFPENFPFNDESENCLIEFKERQNSSDKTQIWIFETNISLTYNNISSISESNNT